LQNHQKAPNVSLSFWIIFGGVMVIDETMRFLCVLGIVLSVPCGMCLHYETEGFWPATIIVGFAGGVSLSWVLYCFYVIIYIAITGVTP
jgi:hypothetical protein